MGSEMCIRDRYIAELRHIAGSLGPGKFHVVVLVSSISASAQWSMVMGPSIAHFLLQGKESQAGVVVIDHASHCREYLRAALHGITKLNTRRRKAVPFEILAKILSGGNRSFRLQVVSPTGRFAYTGVDSSTQA